MHEFKVVALENTKMRHDVRASFLHWREEAKKGNVKASAARAPDFRRWSYVLNLIAPQTSYWTYFSNLLAPPARSTPDLLDVGVGLGQFVEIAAATKRFDRVRGVDFVQYKELDVSRFEFIRHDITKQPPPDLRADIVTCLECIEHIKDPAFDKAVEHLKVLARERLVISVPYDEKEPLPPYHHQRFDAPRLRRLFPEAEITLLANGTEVSWALIDMKLNRP